MKVKDKQKQSLRSAGAKASTPKHVKEGKGKTEQAKGGKKKSLLNHLPILPIPIIAFLLIWWWTASWQGDVFRMMRENSFFVPDSLMMRFETCLPYGMLWCAGRALLMLFRYPWLGGAVLSFILTLSCWLLGYAMRLKAGWRWIQWLPLAAYTGIFTYQGINNYFESETGQAMGIPLAILAILIVWGVMIRSFSRKPSPAFLRIPKDESPRANYLQLLVIIAVGLLPAILYGNMARAYVRPIARMQVGVMEQDWDDVIKTAEANAEQSYRPLAANFAIALVQTGQVGERFFNIRLDYDSLYIVGMNGDRQNALGLYQMECDLHAGLVQTAYHHAMENMAMLGPTLRNLKTLCKASLLRNEWEVAEKYLTILDRVPLEGDFVEKYRPMLRNSEAVNSDPEFAVIRSTEPIHDNFENHLVQPVFLGYTASLAEGRSTNALYNSLMVNIYTKTMPDFLMRSQGITGQTPPLSIAQALNLMSSKYPEIMQSFNGLNLYSNDLQNFLNETAPYVQSRPGITEEEKAQLRALGHTPSGTDTLTSSENRALHARELFPRYKGYYPYYYFFGNLKATKKRDNKGSSNAGVN